MIEYQKIETPFMRDEKGTKKLIEGEYRNELVEYLKNCEWIFTEKIDGTNIGVVWDGHNVSFQGRTEKAQIPANLVNRLNELFGGDESEEMFEQNFGAFKFILFGEGFGAKIQNGGNYIPDGVDFILFDVYAVDAHMWLRRESVEDIAQSFGIRCVPIVGTGSIEDAVNFVKTKPDSTIGTAKMEGVVCRPKVDISDRRGNRLIVKVKVKDFE